MPVLQPLVSVKVPATSANVGVGFDSIGLALAAYNRFDCHFEASQPFEASTLCCHATSPIQFLPLQHSNDVPLANNVFFEAVIAFFDRTQQPLPKLSVQCWAELPLARGLGSSATAVVGALVACNEAMGRPLSTSELLTLAIELEGHPDNVAPALLGGCQLGTMTASYPLPWPSDWHCLALIPSTPISTHEARKALPDVYPRASVALALRHSALFVEALHRSDAALAKQVLASDVVHEPYRGTLIPAFFELQAAFQQLDACIACCISGSGSTVLVIYEANADTPTRVTALLESHWKALQARYPEALAGVAYRPLALDTQGAVLLPWQGEA